MTGSRERAAPAGGAALAPGLYLVATPIGHARDITLRALDVLAAADTIAAEDTRRTRGLLSLHGIALAGRKLVSYNDRNGADRRPDLLARLAAGASVALVSDAGTPLLADPGFRLARAAVAAGHAVTAVPGASALLAALSVAGMPTDRFLFAGFPPARVAARRRFLAEFVHATFTVVLYESPRRAGETLQALADLCGPEREAALCRELTKLHEETIRGPLGALAAQFATVEPRGETVIVLGPAPAAPAQAEGIEARLRAALSTLSLKDAVRRVAGETGLGRRDIYARALALVRG